MTDQGHLFGDRPRRPRPFTFDGLAFGGDTFNSAIDGARLTSQFHKVLQFMLQGDWRTLADIHAATGEPEASISARLRQFKQAENGGYDVQKRRRTADGGTWEYRVRPGTTRPPQTGVE